ncbi:MAG: hypothetical protein KA164_13565 [Rhodoferax sp.]|nr:hypothetical protein [Rhodoferax sp.]
MDTPATAFLALLGLVLVLLVLGGLAWYWLRRMQVRDASRQNAEFASTMSHQQHEIDALRGQVRAA